MQHLGQTTFRNLHAEGAMTSLGLATINHQYAVGRSRELLAEADRDRQVAQARRGKPARFDSVGTAARLAIGRRLVRIGERIARPGWTGLPAAGIAVAGR